MSKIVKGKLCRIDTVVGVVFSPSVEQFFREISERVEESPLLPQGTKRLYQVDHKVLSEFGVIGHPRDPLRDQNGEVNLHFLRAEGIGQNDANFDDPRMAVSKWFPEESDKRDVWLDFVESRGFDRQNPPHPPGTFIGGCESKYSNQAIKSVMQSVKEVSQEIYQNFIQPAELEFTVEVSADE
jgi:hypothetical protein